MGPSGSGKSTLLRTTKSFGKVLDLSDWDSSLPVLLQLGADEATAMLLYL